MTRDEIANSLRGFKTRRDSLLHEDVAAFDHNLERFLSFCATDPLVQQVVASLKPAGVDPNDWWTAATKHEPETAFPANPEQELGLRYALLKSVRDNPNHIFQLGIAHHQRKRDGWVEFFRSLVVRPLVDDLTHKIGVAADIATPEARTLQAVPLARIPGSKEAKIFLSHKSVDKPLVRLYYDALKTLGFDPWLDEHAMTAGSNLERELLQG